MSKKIQKDSKIKTEWDLSQIYKSLSDQQIEIDIKQGEKLYSNFAKKYTKRTDYLKNEHALYHALQDLEKLERLHVGNPSEYLHLSQDLNSRDEKVRATANLISQRMQKIGNSIIFFGVNLAKVPLNIQKKFLKSKKLAPYKYLLIKTFENGKHTLTEAEERILSLKSLPAHSLWVKAVEKIKNKQEIEYKGKKISLSQAGSLSRELPTQKERLEIHNKIMDVYYDMAEIAESELNAIVTDKKIEDELRGFKEPSDSTIMAYENDKDTVLNLINIVTANFHLSQRFYVVKKKMLGLKTLTYTDRSTPVGTTSRKVSFIESYNILLDLFINIDKKFGEILKNFAEKGKIDAFPRIGKSGGAYCSHGINTPTFVLLNHNDSFESLRTFAHEMGHAIHNEFSKSQPSYYESYSMSSAETASTLFESFLFYNQFEKLSEEEKVIALHDKIQDDVQTIFRQIACYNFEVEMHNTIRLNGNMSKEELSECMNRHMKSYIGDVKLTNKDGYFFVGWPHLRYEFYVYSYAFGQLASKALYKKYSEDKTYIEKIKQFLSAGGSMSPEDIFKSIGVDVKKPDFWRLGIKSIEDDINLLEKLVNQKKKR